MDTYNGLILGNSKEKLENLKGLKLLKSLKLVMLLP